MKPPTHVTAGRDDPTGGNRGFDVVDLVVRDVQAIGRAGHPYQYLEGLAVPYGTWANVGMFMEAHAAGSLKQSTSAGKGRTLPLLLFHDNRSFPVGVSERWTHTDGGLEGVWKLNDSPEAQQAAGAAERGELTGLSIGFQPIRSEWDLLDWDDWDPDLGPDHMDHVTRLESRLVEVSITPTPAFTGAQVNAVRSTITPASSRDVVAAFRSGHLGEAPDPAAELRAWQATVAGLKSPQH